MEIFNTHFLLTYRIIRQKNPKKLALSYIFANLFKALRNTKQLDSQIYFCFQFDVLSHIEYLWKTLLFTHETNKSEKGPSKWNFGILWLIEAYLENYFKYLIFYAIINRIII